MANINNRAIVDKAVDILSDLYKKVLRQHNLSGNVDFSGLSEQIMAALEQGSTDKIESIISKFVDNKIRNYDKVAGELAIKANKASNHRKTVDDLIGFSKKWNSQCAEAIARNVTIEKPQLKAENKSFRESLADFRSDSVESGNEISVDEALQKNAQALYEKTGKVPEGYMLNQDGKVIKERSSGEISKDEPQENSKDNEIQL